MGFVNVLHKSAIARTFVQRVLGSIEAFLEGRTEEIIRNLKLKMNAASANEDYEMPSASDVRFFHYMENVNIESFIQEVLITIIDESHNNYGQEFFTLSSDEQLQLINVLKRKHLRLFNSL